MVTIESKVTDEPGTWLYYDGPMSQAAAELVLLRATQNSYGEDKTTFRVVPAYDESKEREQRNAFGIESSAAAHSADWGLK